MKTLTQIKKRIFFSFWRIIWSGIHGYDGNSYLEWFESEIFILDKDCTIIPPMMRVKITVEIVELIFEDCRSIIFGENCLNYTQ